MSRRFVRLALLFAALHYLVLLGLAGLIFLFSHVPPKAVNLDAVILGLANVETVLVSPRKFFLWIWPGESTPRYLGFVASLFNSLLWGFLLAGCKTAWRKMTT